MTRQTTEDRLEPVALAESENNEAAQLVVRDLLAAWLARLLQNQGSTTNPFWFPLTFIFVYIVGRVLLLSALLAFLALLLLSGFHYGAAAYHLGNTRGVFFKHPGHELSSS